MEQLIEFAGNNFILVASFFFVLTLLVMNLMQDGGRNTLTAQQAINLLNKEEAIPVDIRSRKEFETGHIVNAIHVETDDIKKGSKELERLKDRKLVLYCANGPTAVATARTLKRSGYSEVYSLKGGVTSWRSDNLPLTNTSDKSQ